MCSLQQMSKCWLPGGQTREFFGGFREILRDWAVDCPLLSMQSAHPPPKAGGLFYRLFGWGLFADEQPSWVSYDKSAKANYHLRYPRCPWDTVLVPLNLGDADCPAVDSPSEMQGISTSLLPK